MAIYRDLPQADSPTAPTAPAPAPAAASTSYSTSAASTAGDDKATARNLGGISGFNAQSVRDQYLRAMRGFDESDAQNRALANTQIKQHQKTAADDRFAQAKKLQSSASDVIGSAGNALQGSGLGGLIDMLRGRMDMDTNEVFGALKQNKNSVWNALQEATNSNINARNDAGNQAEASLRAIEADMAAQLNNIDPSLYRAPGSGVNLGSAGFANDRFTKATAPQTSGYYYPIPHSGTQTGGPGSRVRDAQGGSSYFDSLINSYINDRRTW